MHFFVCPLISHAQHNHRVKREWILIRAKESYLNIGFKRWYINQTGSFHIAADNPAEQYERLAQTPNTSARTL